MNIVRKKKKECLYLLKISLVPDPQNLAGHFSLALIPGSRCGGIMHTTCSACGLERGGHTIIIVIS